MDAEDDVIQFLKDALTKEEAMLREMEQPIEAQREKVRRLRASLSAQQTGTFGSHSVTDQDIVEFLTRNSSESERMMAVAIAEGMSLDTRGLSRRLPRMVKDGLLSGAPEKGYCVASGYENVAALSPRRAAKRQSQR